MNTQKTTMKASIEPESTQDNLRNLLTVAVGTISNQTGESFDSACLRGKCADEILRRHEQVTAQRDALLAACKELVRVYEVGLDDAMDWPDLHITIHEIRAAIGKP